MAAAASNEKFLTSDLKDVSAAVQATCIMAGPTDLTTPAFVSSLRNAQRDSNTFKWTGKLYDDAPDLYKEASPITHFTKSTGPVLFITGSLDSPERDSAGIEAPLDKNAVDARGLAHRCCPMSKMDPSRSI